MGALLSGRSLTLRYGGVTAVGNVTIEVGHCELVGLIGPNGAGKTSLLDGLSGFAPMTGSVRLDGDRIDGRPPHRRARQGIARTWQAHQLFDDLTVRENVEVAADRAGWRSLLRDIGKGALVRTRAAEDALGRVGVTALAERLPAELSHGQRALVGVARALAAGPSVLLMDEPAAGLDTEESLKLGTVLRQIVADGTSILLVEHDMALVRQICDRVYVLNFGSLIASGYPADVYSNPAVMAAYLGDTATPPSINGGSSHAEPGVPEGGDRQ
jgi:branched-chain amino acid transport system ATP-binding protein